MRAVFYARVITEELERLPALDTSPKRRARVSSTESGLAGIRRGSLTSNGSYLYSLDSPTGSIGRDLGVFDYFP